ncbi:MAG: peptide ABC transporter substrate-binding protein [Microbacterium sp.]|jgi:peptide/nickel transport system substrate-binding protein|uniref:Peptide ABC transporter substrate-binding protein n=1 Tax=Microbacterium ginsengisoli TaxID=400772 RepID=A0A0F0LRQ5_9MICO|nr:MULTISPECIES: ABC transporter substrate-binding protein [Microbacterium]MAL05582.1 peptide ABC transporter substrate-binding protein [Microbacterium sp.]MCK9919866.1 ABC transporter substrate-binding protein [Microbacteriaceae bacterium K1510]KJL35917.1 putative D,D-dipeptide-binding periplasmic protein DdpA precursor [Microbacterium ginsengisoli]KQR92054.1 peptide ABC transporter substrate-binding protein [Microbacterium sp. Leaf347]KQS05823.1 peptide ABC transporter substrate-binding prot
MTLSPRTRGRLGLVVAAVGASALLLAGCSGSSSSSSSGSSEPLLIGTTDKITSIDPAGSYDNGSFAVMNQVYPFLLNSKYGTSEVTPDIATSAEYTSPTEYTVKLKPGLKFANGHDLTSSDVKFSFDRQVAINDPNGPASLLGNLDSVATPDDTTVVFTLKAPNDQTWPQILSSPAAPIVDEQVFSATAVTPDDTIVAGNAFAGQYTIDSYKKNELIDYKPYAGYQGELGAAANGGVTVKYYADSSNLKLDVSNNAIDVAFRSLTATDIADLKSNNKVQVVDGPGGEIRYIVFNFNTQPYGATTAEADPAKALAVRQAAASLVDRAAISQNVYKGTYTPLYSYVPQGLAGATESLKSLYGDGNGGPSLDKAKQILEAAGVTTPVTLNLQYNGDHYGPSSGDEYAAVKSQLENGGLFTVNLAQTEWVQYSKDRVADVYPAYQLGWFPDYSDADNYLTPFFSKDNFLKNHYDNAEVQDLITKQASDTDAASRATELGKIQDLVAQDLSTLPLLQGTQTAVVGSDVQGATLDGSFKFRYAPLHK